MPPRAAPPTWRLLELLAPAAQEARSRYQQVAERVRRTSIRSEGCGARFEDLEAYRVHPCEVRYR